jgi:DNA-binding CsgD family transcriptional regulator
VARTARWDSIRAVEACYRFTDSDEVWLNGLVEAVRPLIDDGFGVGAWTYAPGRWTSGRLPIGIEPSIGERMFATPPYFTAAEIARCFCSSRVGSLAERTGYGKKLLEHPALRLHHSSGIKDFLGLTVADSSGEGAVLVAPLRELGTTSKPLRARLERLGAHLHAAMRLKRSLLAEDAVFSPDGRTVHAQGDAKDASARERLKCAVIAMEKARSQLGRSNPEEALSSWQALVAGRWSIVERFESDGRRYLLARANVPGSDASMVPTPLEQHALLLRAQSVSLKIIGYELGVTVGTASKLVQNGIHKLGLGNELELAALYMSQVEQTAATLAAQAQG